MADNHIPEKTRREALQEAIHHFSEDDRRLLRSILADELGGQVVENVPVNPTLREARAEYLALKRGWTPRSRPAAGRSVKISFHTPSHLADDLQAVAQERQTSIDSILTELLSTSLALLHTDHLSGEDMDSLAVRRDLAAASVAALGDFWDNEADRAWQDFQP